MEEKTPMEIIAAIAKAKHISANRLAEHSGMQFASFENVKETCEYMTVKNFVKVCRMLGGNVYVVIDVDGKKYATSIRISEGKRETYMTHKWRKGKAACDVAQIDDD